MKYSSQGKQLTLDIFTNTLEKSLDPENRWCKLANAMPWDKIELMYNKTLDNERNGAGNKPARMIIGALIVKHQMCLSDEETIARIKENTYMQYFVGLQAFSNLPLFDSSLFVHIPKRLGVENINSITQMLIEVQSESNSGEEEKAKTDTGGEVYDSNHQNVSNSVSKNSFTDEDGTLHRGNIIIDATCCDAEVKYPTDIGLLHDAVRVSVRVIKSLCEITQSPHPKTFDKAARKKLLAVVRKKRMSKSLIRNGIKQQLTYLRRNMDSIVKIISENSSACIERLKHKERQFINTCIKVYYQQKGMFEEKTHQCKDRIISVFQPHVRPIVRGKSKAKVEFGSKIGVSVVNGYTFIDHFSWDAYNESEDLRVHLERYRERFGCLAVKCYADKIYLNRENRRILRENHIQVAGKPLGRPTKEMQTAEYKQQALEDNGVRNGVEATFGTGKRVYRANNIKTKLPDTADTWTAMCYLVKNIKMCSATENNISNDPSTANVPIEKGNTILNLYKIETDPIVGGMGRVYRVHHTGWNVELAMKQPKRELFQNEKQKADFIKECEHWINLGLHPHIVSCYYVREIEDIPSIFAEWMDGGSLKGWIESGALYEGSDKAVLERILDISIQFARGLHYAHEQGLIHRDVKPDNLLLTKGGEAKVADFGIANARAKVADTDSSGGKTIVLQGNAYTPAYCSPEQVRREELTHRTDIWSWAVSMLEMFMGDRQWHDGTVAGRVYEEYFGTERITIPEALKDLLRHCFRENEAERPYDFKEIENELLTIYQTATGNAYTRVEPKAASDTADSLNNKALSFLDMGQPEKAEKCWEKALDLYPNDPVAFYNQTVYFWQERKIEDLEAAHRLSALHKLMKNSWQTGILLAKIHMLRFDAESAINGLESVEEEADDEGRREIHLLHEKCQKILVTHKLVLSYKASHPVHSKLCISNDEQYFIFGAGFKSNSVEIWDTHQNEVIQTLKSDTTSSISISEDNRLIMFDRGLSLLVYELQTGESAISLNKRVMKMLSVCFVKEKIRICKRTSDDTYEISDFTENDIVHVNTIIIPLVTSASFGYGGKFIGFITSERKLALYDVESGQCLKISSSDYYENIRTVSISSDGKHVLVNHIFELEPPKLIDIFNDRLLSINTYFSGTINHFCSLYFTPDGNKMVYQKPEGFVSLTIPPMEWKSDFILQQVKSVDALLSLEFQIQEFTGKIQQALAEKKIPEALELLDVARNINGFTKSENYESLCLEISKYCRIQSIRSCKRLNFFSGGRAVKATHDGMYILTYGGSEQLNLWDTKKGKHIQTYAEHTDLVTCAAFTPDDAYMVSAGDDNSVKIWETFSGKCVFNTTLSVRKLCISPDGRYAYMTENEGLSGKTKLNVQSLSFDKGYSLKNADLGKERKSLAILDIKNKTVFRALPIFEKITTCSLVMNPDGHKCIMGGSIRPDSEKSHASIIIREFDPNLGSEMGKQFNVSIINPPNASVLGQVSSLAVSKDGKFIVSGVDCDVIVSDMVTDQYMKLSYDNHGVEAVAITPDNSFVFSGYLNGCIRIADIRSGQLLHTFQEYSKLADIYYDPNRHILYSSYEGGTGCAHQLDFEYEFPGWADWDEGALPYLEIFLTVHPNWTNEDFIHLIDDLQKCGYGWLRPERVRVKLKKMTKYSPKQASSEPVQQNKKQSSWKRLFGRK